MNRTFEAIVAALVLAVGFAGSVAAGPFEDAGTAYMKGDYATASRLLRPLAEQGNADAQDRLTLIDVGTAHRKGDYATVLRLVRPLAEQGNGDPQGGRISRTMTDVLAGRRSVRPVTPFHTKIP
jgi:uncharacterized protein